jgi:hypothetical protein
MKISQFVVAMAKEASHRDSKIKAESEIFAQVAFGWCCSFGNPSLKYHNDAYF